MRTTSSRLPALVLACALPACGSDPDTTKSTDSSGTATTGTDTTGAATTGENTDPATGATSTGTGETGTGSTGEPGSTGSTGAASGTDSSTGDTSTGDAGGLGQAAQDAAAGLEVAVDGVLYLSESEDTWTVFAIAGAAPVTDQNVKDVIAQVYVPHDDLPLADRAVELRTLAQLMDPLTVMQDWWGEFEVMQAEDYKAIRAIFEGQLSNVQVFRLGEQFGDDLMGAIDVFVIGETADGDLVGMFTIAVET